MSVLSDVSFRPTGTDAAKRVTKAGGSTPAEERGYWGFDDTTIQYVDVVGRLQGYDDSSGITVTLTVEGDTASSGNLEIEGAVRTAEASEDLDTSHSYSYQTTGSFAAPTTIGARVQTSALTFTHAQLDGATNGDYIILRLRRDTGVASNMSGDMLLFGVDVNQT